MVNTRRTFLKTAATAVAAGATMGWKSIAAAAIQSRVSFQHCQTRPLVAEAGTLVMAEENGLGPSLDEARLERL